MNTQEAMEILQTYNLWRRGEKPYDKAGVKHNIDPKSLGDAIDCAVHVLALTPPKPMMGSMMMMVKATYKVLKTLGRADIVDAGSDEFATLVLKDIYGDDYYKPCEKWTGKGQGKKGKKDADKIVSKYGKKASEDSFVTELLNCVCGKSNECDDCTDDCTVELHIHVEEDENGKPKCKTTSKATKPTNKCKCDDCKPKKDVKGCSYTFKCKNCGKTFTTKANNARYCTKTCKNAARRKPCSDKKGK